MSEAPRLADDMKTQSNTITISDSPARASFAAGIDTVNAAGVGAAMIDPLASKIAGVEGPNGRVFQMTGTAQKEEIAFKVGSKVYHSKVKKQGTIVDKEGPDKFKVIFKDGSERSCRAENLVGI